MKYLCLSIGILCCLLTACGAETEQISELSSAEETTVSTAETTAVMTDDTTVTDVTTETGSAETASATTAAAEPVSPYARTIPEDPNAQIVAPSSRTTETTRQTQPQTQNNASPVQPSRNTAQPAQQDHAADQAAARADYDRIAGEVAAAQANADAAAQRCNAARDSYNAAVQQRDQYQNENRGAIEGITQGAFGFYTAMGAQSALDALNNATYASYTRRGEETDATSLTNMKKSFAFMRECNQLRAAEGVGELRVTDRLMAIAQSDLNWSDGNVTHSRQFSVGENLAWNYSDPFSGWYDAEKPTRGGHYLNIINSGYATTGFAVCTAGRSGTYSVSHGQVFDFASGEASYTVDEYEARFDNYCSSLGGVQQQWAALNQAVADAEAQVNTTTAQLNEANNILAQKQQQLQAAQARLQ